MLSELLSGMYWPVRRRVFVSYHHEGDQVYYDEFSKVFAEGFDAVHDRSVDRIFDSGNPEYVMRRIREKYTTGTSCTIVLCGTQTPWRKYVDWEIKASLDKEYGLIGIKLSTDVVGSDGRFGVPDRLWDNLNSLYALCTQWEEVIRNPASLAELIEPANVKPKRLISNSRSLRPRNG